jgi:SNF2 family DNA or RNA helicase
MKYSPYKYQQAIADHIVKNPACGVFAQMGLGKTSATLLALKYLMFTELEIDKPLIVAPKNVAESTWPAEIAKWDQFKNMTISIIAGNQNQRIAAIKRKADIYIIGRDNIVWLIAFMPHFPFDCLVLDESSSYKNSDTHRFKALKMIRPLVKRVINLTGTPAPNGLMDLWAQIYLLDRGQRLGDHIGGYRTRYYNKRPSGWGYEPKNDADDTIHELISDICISMKTEDYLDLPDMIEIPVPVRLSDKALQQYNEFERTQVMEIEDKHITAVNAGALVTKLLQFSNGAVYDANKVARAIHSEKLDALDELLEMAENQGENVLVFYSYQHDIDRILQRHKNARKLERPSDIEDWNAGNIPIFILHPASAGHGLNLQFGGHVAIWFGPTYSLELWLQANARLHRQGVTAPVRIYTLIAEGTIDEDVMVRIADRMQTQDALMDAVKFRIEKYMQEII